MSPTDDKARMHAHHLFPNITNAQKWGRERAAFRVIVSGHPHLSSQLASSSTEECTSRTKQPHSDVTFVDAGMD